MGMHHRYFGGVELTVAIEVWDEDRESFPDALREELERHADQLPLEPAMSHGGWIVPTSLEIEVHKFREQNGTLLGKVTLFFDEEYRSGCSDNPGHESHRAKFELSIDLRSGETSFEYKQVIRRNSGMTLDEREDWDLRNSEY